MAAVVQDVEPRVQYVATPGQTEFDFPFLVYSDSAGQGSYLVVKRTRSGTTTTLAEGTDYTISGLDTTGGGTITLTSGATAGDILTMYRDLPIQTFFTFATAGDYFATDVNKQNNLLLQIVQQLDMRLNRALFAPLEALIDALSLPSPDALKYLRWNAAGDDIENASGTSSDFSAGTAVGDVVLLVDTGGGVAGFPAVAFAMGDKILARPEIKDYAETVKAIGNSGTAATVDLENGNVQTVTMTGNCTFTFSNPPATGKGGSFTLILTQDGTGSRTATWPAAVKWAGGSAPTLSTAAAAIDVLTFITTDGGTSWLGFTGGLDFS
jgi:hypothetical protein